MPITRVMHFTDERRIQSEGQKDGERNIPEMGSYSPAPFEQALIANGEQKTQRVYEKTSGRIAKLQSMYEGFHRRFEDIEARYQRLCEMFHERKRELGRDIAIPFPTKFHWGLILFLGIGEFPLNTVVFRLFGEAEYLTYIMASTLAITIPLLGLFIGLHMRQSIPRTAGNVLIGLLTPIAVGSALFSISILRGAYISSQASPMGLISGNENQMQYVLFTLNILVFFAALVSSFFAHDPDEKLNVLHSSLIFVDQKRQRVQKKMFRAGTRINGEIRRAKSRIGQIRSLTNERVALYRQTNLRFRNLLPPPTFRRDPDFPQMDWWSEVSINGFNKS